MLTLSCRYCVNHADATIFRALKIDFFAIPWWYYKYFTILNLPQASELGGVPMLIRSADMSNTIPDQKITAIFLTYLAARLLDLSAEMTAARTIQLFWRRYSANKREKEFKVKFTNQATGAKWMNMTAFITIFFLRARFYWIARSQNTRSKTLPLRSSSFISHTLPIIE